MAARDRNAERFQEQLDVIIEAERSAVADGEPIKTPCPENCGGEVVINLRKQTGLAIVKCSNFQTSKCGSPKLTYFPGHRNRLSMVDNGVE